MDSYVQVDGDELRRLIARLLAHEDHDEPVRVLRLHLRDAGVSVQINEGMWSLAIGRRVKGQ